MGNHDRLLTSLSIVVPVYRSTVSLIELTGELERILPGIAVSYEVIYVDDGSPAESWRTICSLASQHSWVRGIALMRNYGQHNALLCGIRAARGEITVTLDDDLQHPPAEIPKLIGRLSEGYDVVYGTPAQEKHELWRILASRVTKFALRTTIGIGIAERVSAFRAFRTVVRKAFDDYTGGFVSIDVLLTWATDRFGAVPVAHQERKHGESNYTFRQLIGHALNMVTGFSTVPLQVASIVGFAFTVFGFLVLVYVVGRYLLQGTPVAGFPFLASIIAIFSGAQLFALGVIGEYIARIHFRAMRRPAYTLRTTTDDVSASTR